LAESGVDELDRQGVGDQGLMFGYATDKTPELMPLPIGLAHRLSHRLAEASRKGVHRHHTVRTKCNSQPFGSERRCARGDPGPTGLRVQPRHRTAGIRQCRTAHCAYW
jgi:hypothetical protein